MTSRERLLTVLRGEIPDCVPVSPDFSNMIPAKRTGKPFWDIYLYNNPPIWEAYVDCARHFDIDALMDGYFPLTFPEELAAQPEKETLIVYRDESRIVTQACWTASGKKIWDEFVTVYYADDPPSWNVKPAVIGLPAVPEKWEPVGDIKPVDTGPGGLARLKNRLGDQGLVGVWLTKSLVLKSQDDIFDYYDNPEKYKQIARQRVIDVEKRFDRIMAMEVKPDFLCVGSSGTLVFQSLEIFRELALPAVKRGIELAYAAGIPTHIHSCGPEAELVRLMAEETNLTVIDPLEIPPMGNCNLAELKKLYGNKIVLKGNLHTTEVMLRGTVDEVIAAAKQAIDDAAADGRFILSTGDQCGRDTPEENLHALVQTARTYGRY